MKQNWDLTATQPEAEGLEEMLVHVRNFACFDGESRQIRLLSPQIRHQPQRRCRRRDLSRTQFTTHAMKQRRPESNGSAAASGAGRGFLQGDGAIGG